MSDLRGKTANVTRPDMLTKGTGNRVDDGHGVEFIPNFGSMPQVAGNPIVERGSNADGEWVRFADGTQVCHRALFGSGSSTARVTWTYPLAFLAVPSVTSSVNRSSADNVTGRTSHRETSATGVQIWRIHDDAFTLTVSAIVIGRWF